MQWKKKFQHLPTRHHYEHTNRKAETRIRGSQGRNCMEKEENSRGMREKDVHDYFSAENFIKKLRTEIWRTYHPDHMRTTNGFAFCYSQDCTSIHPSWTTKRQSTRSVQAYNRIASKTPVMFFTTKKYTDDEGSTPLWYMLKSKLPTQGDIYSSVPSNRHSQAKLVQQYG